MASAVNLAQAKKIESDPVNPKQAYETTGAPQEDRIQGASGVLDRRPPAADWTDLNARQKELYGIGENEGHTWIRGEYWESHEFKSRAGEFEQEADGNRIVTMGDGNQKTPVRRGDTVLAVFDKEEHARIKEARAEEERELEARQVEQTKRLRETQNGVFELEGDVEGHPRVRPGVSQAEVDARRMQAVESGMIGPTAGRHYSEVERSMGKDAVEAEQAAWRGMGRHDPAENSKRYKDMDSHAPRPGKIHGMGAGFNKEGKIVR